MPDRHILQHSSNQPEYTFDFLDNGSTSFECHFTSMHVNRCHTVCLLQQWEVKGVPAWWKLCRIGVRMFGADCCAPFQEESLKGILHVLHSWICRVEMWILVLFSFSPLISLESTLEARPMSVAPEMFKKSLLVIPSKSSDKSPTHPLKAFSAKSTTKSDRSLRNVHLKLHHGPWNICVLNRASAHWNMRLLAALIVQVLQLVGATSLVCSW